MCYLLDVGEGGGGGGGTSVYCTIQPSRKILVTHISLDIYFNLKVTYQERLCGVNENSSNQKFHNWATLNKTIVKVLIFYQAA